MVENRSKTIEWPTDPKEQIICKAPLLHDLSPWQGLVFEREEVRDTAVKGTQLGSLNTLSAIGKYKPISGNLSLADNFYHPVSNPITLFSELKTIFIKNRLEGNWYNPRFICLPSDLPNLPEVKLIKGIDREKIRYLLFVCKNPREYLRMICIAHPDKSRNSTKSLLFLPQKLDKFEALGEESYEDYVNGIIPFDIEEYLFDNFSKK